MRQNVMGDFLWGKCKIMMSFITFDIVQEEEKNDFHFLGNNSELDLMCGKADVMHV